MKYRRLSDEWKRDQAERAARKAGAGKQRAGSAASVVKISSSREPAGQVPSHRQPNARQKLHAELGVNEQAVQHALTAARMADEGDESLLEDLAAGKAGNSEANARIRQHNVKHRPDLVARAENVSKARRGQVPADPTEPVSDKRAVKRIAREAAHLRENLEGVGRVVGEMLRQSERILAESTPDDRAACGRPAATSSLRPLNSRFRSAASARASAMARSPSLESTYTAARCAAVRCSLGVGAARACVGGRVSCTVEFQ